MRETGQQPGTHARGVSLSSPWGRSSFPGAPADVSGLRHRKHTHITITWAEHHLQTPMYFFLSSFSFLECCFTTTSLFLNCWPSFCWGGKKFPLLPASHEPLLSFPGSSCFLPNGRIILGLVHGHLQLYYATIMNPRMCSLLATACLVSGSLTGSSYKAFSVIRLWLPCHSSSSVIWGT